MINLSDKIFGNIVAILKTISVLIYVVGIIACIVLVISEMAIGFESGGILMLCGLGSIIVGYLLALPNYALAKLIENTQKDKTE